MAAGSDGRATWEARWWFPAAGGPREVLHRFADWTGALREHVYPVLLLAPDHAVRLCSGGVELRERRSIVTIAGAEPERWETTPLDAGLPLGDRPDLVPVCERVAWRELGGGAHLEVASVRLLDGHGWTMAAVAPVALGAEALVDGLSAALADWPRLTAPATPASHSAHVLRVSDGGGPLAVTHADVNTPVLAPRFRS